MAEFVAHRAVTNAENHPDADNLVILTVGKFTVIHSKEAAKDIKPGQIVTHFPTDICIDPTKAEELGVAKYLKKAPYQGGPRVPCRVTAARLRGVPSYGFISLDTSVPDYALDDHYGVWKWEPPPPPENLSGVRERYEHPDFPKYTKIKRIQLKPDAWEEGIPVRVTEKLHGTNVRFGVVKVDDEWRFMVGSHNVIVREYNQDGVRNKYWSMLDAPIMELLNYLCDGEKPVVVFGEILGPGIQDLDYGFEEPVLRVFDVMVDGKYLDWDLVSELCELHKVATVPLLTTGKFTWNMVKVFTDGNSVINHPSLIKSQFTGREGVVITPLTETYSSVLGGRLIGKSISCDYESRRGGTEYH